MSKPKDKTPSTTTKRTKPRQVDAGLAELERLQVENEVQLGVLRGCGLYLDRHSDELQPNPTNPSNEARTTNEKE